MASESNSGRPPLSSLLPLVALGGGAFTYQSYPDPTSLPVRSIIQEALTRGVRAFDTSPYYHPSEELLGDAFTQPEVTTQFAREDYLLMTKVGRIAAAEFDYSPSWIRQSVERSLQRLHTTYLDVVFCHDIEYVTDDDAIIAVGVLLDLVAQGQIRYVGVSGYPLARLVRVAELVKERYGRPLDAVQSWGQLNLLNTRLESEGLPALRAAEVDCIFNSSPLAIGLLRAKGVPVGALGDWHPAPKDLREAALKASEWVKGQGENLAALALRFSMAKVVQTAGKPVAGVCMIFAATSIPELDANLSAMKNVLKPNVNEQELKYSDMRDLTHSIKLRWKRMPSWFQASGKCLARGLTTLSRALKRSGIFIRRR